MKKRLIHKYFELREALEWSRVPGNILAGWVALDLDMNRIDLILWERYGYDVSLTRKHF